MKYLSKFSKESITILIFIFLILILPTLSKCFKTKEGASFSTKQINCLNDGQYYNSAIDTNKSSAASTGCTGTRDTIVQGKCNNTDVGGILSDNFNGTFWLNNKCNIPDGSFDAGAETLSREFCDNLGTNIWFITGANGQGKCNSAAPNQQQCNPSGYWWYDNKCNKTEPDTAIKCMGSLAAPVNGSFNATPNGNFWYGNKCHKTLPTTRDECIADPDLYWFKSKTGSTALGDPAAVEKCNIYPPNNFTGCNYVGPNTMGENVLNLWWYDNKCNKGAPDAATKCTGSTRNISAGGATITVNDGPFWYNNESVDPNQPGCYKLPPYPASSDVAAKDACNKASVNNGLDAGFYYINLEGNQNSATCRLITNPFSITQTTCNSGINLASNLRYTSPVQGVFPACFKHAKDISTFDICNSLDPTTNPPLAVDNDGIFWFDKDSSTKCENKLGQGAARRPVTKDSCEKIQSDNQAHRYFWYQPPIGTDPLKYYVNNNNPTACFKNLSALDSKEKCLGANPDYFWLPTLGPPGTPSCKDVEYNNQQYKLKTKEECEKPGNGGPYYWYNNKCNKYLPTGPSINKATCEAMTDDGDPNGTNKGYYWYVTGAASNPAACYNKPPTDNPACNAAGYFWYPLSSDVAATCNRTYDNKTVSANAWRNNGYFYYSVPTGPEADLKTLGPYRTLPTSKAACVNAKKENDLDAGYFWYKKTNPPQTDAVCNTGPPDNANMGSIINAATGCHAQGYYWYKDADGNEKCFKNPPTLTNCNNTNSNQRYYRYYNQLLGLQQQSTSSHCNRTTPTGFIFPVKSNDVQSFCSQTGIVCDNTNPNKTVTIGDTYIDPVTNEEIVPITMTDKLMCNVASVIKTTNTGSYDGDAGYFWYKGPSDPTAKCNLIGPGSTTNDPADKGRCDDAGGYWTNDSVPANKCKKLYQINSIQSKTTCDSLDIGYAAYNYYTSTNQQPAGTARYWYYGNTGEIGPSCKPKMPGDADTCINAGYYWYNDQCNKALPVTGPECNNAKDRYGKTSYIWNRQTNKCVTEIKTDTECLYNTTAIPNQNPKYHWYQIGTGPTSCYKEAPNDKAICDQNQSSWFYFNNDSNKCLKYLSGVTGSATDITDINNKFYIGQDNCNNNGYYFYKNPDDPTKYLCKSNLPETKNKCDAATVTGASNSTLAETQYWYYSYNTDDDSTMRCTKNPPIGVSGPKACNKAGYFWYDNKCNKNLPTDSYSCNNAVAIDIDGKPRQFIWMTAMGSTPASCKTGIAGVGQTDCTNNGYYFYTRLDGIATCDRNPPSDISTCRVNTDKDYFWNPYAKRCEKKGRPASGNPLTQNIAGNPPYIRQIDCKNWGYYYYREPNYQGAAADKPIKVCRNTISPTATSKVACDNLDVADDPSQEVTQQKYWFYSYNLDNPISKTCQINPPTGPTGPAACNAGGYYWYNGQCYKNLPTTRDDCTNAVDENNKKTFYWDSTLTTPVKCTRNKYDNRNNPDFTPNLSEAACTGPGYYFYKDISNNPNNADCYKSLPTTKTACEYGATAYAWYADSCNVTMPGTRDTCENAGYWYYRNRGDLQINSNENRNICRKTAPNNKEQCLGTGQIPQNNTVGVGFPKNDSFNGYYWYKTFSRNKNDDNFYLTQVERNIFTNSCNKSLPSEAFACEYADPSFYYYSATDAQPTCTKNIPTTRSICSKAGYFWYNNTCNRYPPFDEDSCLNNNFNWKVDGNGEYCDTGKQLIYDANTWVEMKPGYGIGSYWTQDANNKKSNLGNIAKIITKNIKYAAYVIEQVDNNMITNTSEVRPEGIIGISKAFTTTTTAAPTTTTVRQYNKDNKMLKALTVIANKYNVTLEKVISIYKSYPLDQGGDPNFDPYSPG